MDAARIKRQQFLKTRAAPLTFGFAAAADMDSYRGHEYLAGIMQATQDYGIHFINMASTVQQSLVSDTYFLPQFVTKMQFMRAPLLDGLITWASSLAEHLTNKKIQALFARLSPLPQVDIGSLALPRVPLVRIDDQKAMQALLRHLVQEHGFMRLVFIGTRQESHFSYVTHFKQVLEALQLSCTDEQLFLSDSGDAHAIFAQVAAAIARYPHGIDAIVTATDSIAVQVIAALEKHNIAVPTDMAVVGCSNQHRDSTAGVPITTIDHAYFARGYKAVELLIDYLQAPEQLPHDVLIEPNLLVRQSCGCFEPAVIDALQPCATSPLADQSKAAKRAYLIRSLAPLFPYSATASCQALAEALLSDIYNTNVPPPCTKTLVIFRRLLKRRHEAHYTAQQWESGISALRRTLLPLVHDSVQHAERVETICHALRVLYSVLLQYDVRVRQNSGQHAMTSIALSIMSCTSLSQLENVLRFKLSALGIPCIVVCLSPYLTEQLAPAAVTLVIPELPADIAKLIPYTVREPKLMPKLLFPHTRRFSVTLELLFHNEKYLGYVYFEHGAASLRVYDDVTALISQALYTLYLHENRIKAHSLVINDRAQLEHSVPLSPKKTNAPKGKLCTQAILDYLIDHLDEMCTLEKMADDFSLSKSHLARRIKALTGYSMQTLHELLKIEQAKALIQSGTLKMNDIAARLGYTNPNYFSNVFKKVTGLSPLNWADRNRNAETNQEAAPLL